jgi:hypothetical protein
VLRRSNTVVGCLQEKKREKQKKKKKKREKERRRKLREEGRVMVAGEEGSAHGGGGGGGGLAPLAAVQQPREGPAQPSLFGAEGSLVSAPGAPHDRDLWCDSQSQAVHTPFSLIVARAPRPRSTTPQSPRPDRVQMRQQYASAIEAGIEAGAAQSAAPPWNEDWGGRADTTQRVVRRSPCGQLLACLPRSPRSPPQLTTRPPAQLTTHAPALPAAPAALPLQQPGVD